MKYLHGEVARRALRVLLGVALPLRSLLLLLVALLLALCLKMTRLDS